MSEGTNRSRVKNTLKNTALGLAMKFVTLIANFAVRTVFIRYLGIEYTGVSAVFTDILTVLSFAELGMGSAITFALYKPIAEKDYRQIARLMNLYKTAYRAIAATVFIVGLALVPVLDKIISNAPTIKESLTVIYLMYIANTSMSYLLIYKSTLLTANQQAYVISSVHVWIVVARTVIQMAVIMLFRQFLLYLILNISFTVLQNVIISIKADKQFAQIKQYKNERLSREESKKIFKNIKAMALYKVSGTVLNGTNSIVISTFLGAGFVGFATNYTMIINEIYALSLQFLNSVTASIGNLVASEDNERQYELFRKLNFVCEWFFCLCTACLLVLLDEFIGTVWLGEEYLISFWAVLFLCLDFYIKGNTTVVSSFRNANGLFVQGQYRPLVMAVLNIVISIIAVNVIGLPGVYLGTVLSRATTQMWYDPLIVYKHAFKKSAKSYFGEYIVWLAVLVTSVVVTKLLNSYIIIPIPVISFVVHALVCAAVVCLLAAVIFSRYRVFHDSIAYVSGIIKKKKEV